jgi:hypothetical protein
MIETKDTLYDQRHGGPWDRGTADSYYSREFNPHYYKGETYNSDLVELSSMTAEEITAYSAGYSCNEQAGNKKEW